MDLSSLNFPHHRVLLKWAFALAGIIIVGAVFVGGYNGLNVLMNLFGGSPSGEVAEAADFSGTLLVSAITLSSTTQESEGIGTFMVSVRENSARYIPVDQLAAGAASTLQYNVSRGGKYATFLGTSSASSTTSKMPAVYTTPLTEYVYDKVISSLQSAQPVALATETDYFREMPVVSPDGEVLYSSLSKEVYNKSSNDLGNLPAENWSIYAITTDGNKHMLTYGLQPKWIDGARFAYLKNDGVYLYDLTTNDSIKVEALEYTPTIANGFDVSDDGQFMAISDPSTESLMIIRILDWNSALVANFANITTTATYPVFSPNSQYLAMLSLEADPADETQRTGLATIKYFSLEKKDFVKTMLPVDLTTIGGMYITDWK